MSSLKKVFGNVRVTKQERGASKNKVGKNEVPGLEAAVIGFETSSGHKRLAKFQDADAKSAVILAVLTNRQAIPDLANKVRTSSSNPNLKEVSCSIHWTPDARLYVERNISDAILGTYRGNLKNILDFWDRDKAAVVTNVWIPLTEQIYGIKVWSGEVPAELTCGSRITLNGAFQVYMYCPEDRKGPFSSASGGGGADKKDDIIAKTVVADPSALASTPLAPQDALQETQSYAKTLRSPEINFTIYTNGRVEFSSKNVTRGAFENLQSITNTDFRLPKDSRDTYSLIFNIGNHQADINSLSELLPGPEMVVIQDRVFDANQLKKAPPKMDPTKTDVREMCKTVGLKVFAYEKESEVHDLGDICWWTVMIPLYEDRLMGIGISSLEHWLKFGGLPWEGIAALQVDAETTMRLPTNQEHHLLAHASNGQLQCHVKNVAWNVAGTVRRYGFPVTVDLLSRLYADIYQDVVTTDNERIVLCPMETLVGRVPANFIPEIHAAQCDSAVINLNEWNGNAGWLFLSNEHEFYVLVHLPVPSDLMPREGENNDEAILEYMERSEAAIRQLSTKELIEVLLGTQAVPNVFTYTQEEMDALKRIPTNKDRAKAYPGRGPASKRKYAGVAKAPSSWGFDFIVYALKKEKEDERAAPVQPIIPAAAAAVVVAAASSSKSTKSSSKKK